MKKDTIKDNPYAPSQELLDDFFKSPAAGGTEPVAPSRSRRGGRRSSARRAASESVSAGGLKKVYLNGLQSETFTRAWMAYRMVTGRSVSRGAFIMLLLEKGLSRLSPEASRLVSSWASPGALGGEPEEEPVESLSSAPEAGPEAGEPDGSSFESVHLEPR